MKWFPRRTQAPAVSTLEPRERVLAWAAAGDGSVLAGSRDALHLAPSGGVAPTRLPWHRIEAATWDVESSEFRVSEVEEWGQPPVDHVFALDEARLLLELVRERVTASIVMQRQFQVPGGGLRVIARRAPYGDDSIFWVFEYDESVDPDAPNVVAAAQKALGVAKADVGLD